MSRAKRRPPLKRTKTRAPRRPGTSVSPERTPSPPRRTAAQAARARRKERAEAERREREAARWFSERQGLDAESMAYRCRTERSCDWQAIVIAHVDWETGRDSWRHVEETHRRTPGALARIERRRNRPGTALSGTCEVCDDVGLWRKHGISYCSDLCARRPGAIAPWDGCQGCVHSYVGELDDDDKSLVDAFSPTVEDLPVHLRHRWRGGHRS